MKLLEKASIRTAHHDAAQEVLEVVPLMMRAIRAEVRRHRAADLTVPQFRTLGFLKRHDGASLSDVAEHIGLTLPSMSKLIDGLVARKLVTREIHAGDRRRVTLTLSARGRATLEAAHNTMRAEIAQRLADLSDGDKSTIVRAMRLLRPLFAGERERASDAERGRNGDS